MSPQAGKPRYRIVQEREAIIVPQPPSDQPVEGEPIDDHTRMISPARFAVQEFIGTFWPFSKTEIWVQTKRRDLTVGDYSDQMVPVWTTTQADAEAWIEQRMAEEDEAANRTFLPKVVKTFY